MELNLLSTISIILIVLIAMFFAVFYYFYRQYWYNKKVIVPRAADWVFLEILMPKEAQETYNPQMAEDGKKQLTAVAEQLYTSLSGVVENQAKFWHPGDYLSLEIVCIDQKISFYINCPRHIQDRIEKLLLSQYPTAFIEELPGYNPFKENSQVAAIELHLKKSAYYPLRTYKTIETDPLNSITNTMSKLGSDEGAVVQLIIAPAHEGWRKNANHFAEKLSEGKTAKEIEQNQFLKLSKEVAKSVRTPSGTPETQKSLTPAHQELIKVIEEKASKPGFRTNLRIITSSMLQNTARVHARNLQAAFLQFNSPIYNQFVPTKRAEKEIITDYIFRSFRDQGMHGILSTEELASIWHLPTPYLETPNIKWLTSKKAPAPVNVPKEGLLLGNNIYRAVETPIYMTRQDRRRHTYILGRTGGGKSVLLANMAIQDVLNGEGLCVIDPHGDLVDDILKHIPKERAEDVIVFNPADLERPLGLNMLETFTEEQKFTTVQEMISIFYKLVTDPAMLGPMFEHNMRNAMLTLMADKAHPGTVVDIPKIFTDDEFLKYKLQFVTDHVVRDFWEKEMVKTSSQQKGEMLPYLISKVGRFAEDAAMRNIVGQPVSGFNIRNIMDEGKILLVKLAKGSIGEINAKLLGLILVSKIQMAALSRNDTPEDQRRDFYLYVDEFQNFITDAFASILSEARKYRLNLIIAHQYLAQLSSGAAGVGGAASQDLRDAVFGNAGTIITFRTGAEDAEFLKKEFGPTFNEFDLVNVDAYNVLIKLMINGTAAKPFNMATVPPRSGGSSERAQAITELSRLKFGRLKAEVEAEIFAASTIADSEQRIDIR